MGIKLNLIPQYRKNEISQSSKLRMILRWEIELAVLMLILFSLFISLDYVLKFNLEAQTSELEGRQDKEGYDKIVNLDNNFKAVNAIVTLDESIQNDQLYWSRMFEKLSDIIPDGVSVSKLANKDYRVMIVGLADTRDILIDMKDKLSQEACFANINLPLSNLVSKDNVEFQIEFDIKEECIKNK